MPPISPRRIGSRPLVAVALAAASELDLAILEGIRASAADWELVVLAGGYESPLRTLAETGELVGAIGDFVSDVWVGDLASRGVRVVQLAFGSRLNRCVNVGPDFSRIGDEAAVSLHHSGSRQIGFAGLVGHDGSDAMEKHMAEACERLRVPFQATRAATLPLLQSWLQGLTPPCGVLAGSDRIARQLVGAARLLQLRVPDDLAVIGIGNSRIESVLAGIGLSSFDLQARAIGRAAAETLRAVMKSPRKSRPDPAPLSARLIERESSLRVKSGVARALAFIHAHFAEPIQVSDLARAAGMSRRALELACREEHAASPMELLVRVRQREAERLLRVGTLPIGQIGAQCGYPELERFSAAFKRWTGQSPRAFRQKKTRRAKRSPGHQASPG